MNYLKCVALRPLIMNKSSIRCMSKVGDLGSGAGRGGGAGGSIREAGGSLGAREAAEEGKFFYEQEKEQLRKLKSGLQEEIIFHEQQIKQHQDAILRHKKRVSEMEKK